MAEPLLQPQAYDAEGNPVAPDVAADAVAKGQAFFKKGTRVYATNARGELVTVDAADAARPGYRVLSQSELAAEEAKQRYGEGLGNIAKAGAAGAARGLTLGASDAALSAIGGEDTRKALQGLRQANPITSTASEIGGAIAPVVLSGGGAAPAAGAGTLARAGQAASAATRALGAGHRAIAGVGGIVERGVARGLAGLGYEGASAAGRIGAAAAKLGARGAAEGALYGAAQAANDSVLNGDDITAEKIIAGMGHGALFGGALGGALGAVGRGLVEAGQKLVPTKEALTQLAREQAGRAAGFKPSDWKALVGRSRGAAAEERIAATLDDLRNYEIKTGDLAGQRILQPADNAEEILARVTHAKNETAAALAGLKDEISEGMQRAGYAPDVAALRQRIEKNVFEPAMEGATPSIHRRIQKAREELAALVERPAADPLNSLGLVNARYARDGMREESLNFARKAYAPKAEVFPGPPMSAAERAQKIATTEIKPVRVELYPGEAPALGDGRHRMQAAIEAGAKDIRANVVTYDAEGKAIGEVERLISLQPHPPQAPGQTFRELDKIRQRIRETFQPPAVRGGGLPPPAPKNAAYLEGAEREIQAFLKEEAGQFLAKAGENPNAYNELNRRYHSFRQLEDVGTKATAHNLGNRMVSPSDHAMGVASFLGALSTGNVGAVGAMAMGAAGTLANKLLRERGNSLVADLARRASETDNVIEHAAQALAGTGEKVKAPAIAATFQGKSLAEQYERTAERVRELAQPAIAQAHVASLMPEVAAQHPNVGGAVAQKLLAIYSELARKLPQSTADTGVTLTPLAVRERVSPLQQRAFLASVEGALNPEKVIADLSKGIVNRQSIEMLKLVHPLVFQQLRTKVADAVQGREKQVPFQRRIMLSTVFDFVGDSSLEPTRFGALQQMTKAMTIQDDLKNQQAAQPKQGNPGSASKLGDALQLPAQAAAGDI